MSHAKSGGSFVVHSVDKSHVTSICISQPGTAQQKRKAFEILVLAILYLNSHVNKAALNLNLKCIQNTVTKKACCFSSHLMVWGTKALVSHTA